MTSPSLHSARVLLVESDREAAMEVGQRLRERWGNGLSVTHVERIEDATRELRERGACCVLLGLDGDENAPIGALEQIHEVAPDAAVVVLADAPDNMRAMAAIWHGAQDYVVKPDLSPTQLTHAVRLAIERKRHEVRQVQQALHDPLTGLPNRALFLDRLGVALDRSRRTGSSVAVLFIDVDNFKQVNDSMGHAAGDELLAGLAERLLAMLRPMDTIARFGGDEFVLLFEELSDEREVVLIADRISRTASAPLKVGDGQATVTVSIGVAVVGDPTVPPETIIREADSAMYRAKQRGRSRYELSDDGSRQRAAVRLELESELRAAVDDGQLCVHYQPEISLNTRAGVAGFEALVRWKHPERGLIDPGHFLPLARETGVSPRIDGLVVADALRQVTRWRESKPDLVVSVNVSAHLLEDGSLVSSLAEALTSAEVDPRALCLEVSEENLSRSGEHAVRALEGLAALGVRLAVDDYGIGSVPLDRLARLPIEKLKTHHSVLSGLGADPAQTRLMAAIVEFGHAMGLAIVASGVETDNQLAALRDAGCDGAQGFLFCPAVPPGEVEALLSVGRRGTLLQA